MISPDRLKAVSFFASFPRSAIKIIADRAIERRFATGDILFRAGEPAAGLMVVMEGKVRVVRKAGDRAQVVHVEKSGGTLGEVPVFGGGGYPATAFAAEPTVCAVVGREILLAAVKSNPETAFVLLERLAKRVRELVERLDRTALRPVSARLAEYLVARADARGRAVVAIGMTQQQLAEELGTVREVIVRELHALRTSGLVRALGGGRFEIVDAPALRARAADGAARAQRASGAPRPQNVKVHASAGAPSAATTGDGPSRALSKRLPGR
jgi:CRP/FNR family transcriptional regulator